MQEIIPQILAKFKEIRQLAKDLFFVFFFVFVVSIAFVLGRTVKFLENRPAFYFESFQAEQSYSQQMLESERQGLFGKFEGGNNSKVKENIIVASKSGKKYYFVWCKGAENIKEKNKRYFADENAANIAGYTKASSCK